MRDMTLIKQLPLRTISQISVWKSSDWSEPTSRKRCLFETIHCSASAANSCHHRHWYISQKNLI